MIIAAQFHRFVTQPDHQAGINPLHDEDTVFLSVLVHLCEAAVRLQFVHDTAFRAGAKGDESQDAVVPDPHRNDVRCAFGAAVVVIAVHVECGVSDGAVAQHGCLALFRQCRLALGVLIADAH